MGKKIRLVLALFFWVLVTLLFLDFTGTIQGYFSWMAKLQFLPALLAVNVAAIAVVVLLTFIFGRIYCSVICPLGVMQDFFSWIGGKRKKNRFSYKPAKSKVRYIVLGLFALSIILGTAATVYIAPYSAYGRMATYLFAPIYDAVNNLLAYFAQESGSYMFYEKEIVFKGGIAFAVALISFIAIAAIAFFKGRAYCNTICPVGTFLSFIARFSLFRPVIDKSKCIKCRRCERNCKSSCIDAANGTIDYSRCVTCLNCTGICSKKAISYKFCLGEIKSITPQADKVSGESVDQNRRKFLGIATVFAAGAMVKAHAQVDEGEGGLAPIEEKLPSKRNAKIVPPGSKGHRSFDRNCTACGLCIANCPNDVLRPGADLKPFSSYEKGYCRPECTRCSEVCPAGAITKITAAEKSSTQIGHAVYIEKNCVVNRDGVECGNCARHCPTGAIQMVPKNPSDPTSPKIPVVNVERCIGCGACENLCPSRPYSAIYVEGHEVHRTV